MSTRGRATRLTRITEIVAGVPDPGSADDWAGLPRREWARRLGAYYDLSPEEQARAVATFRWLEAEIDPGLSAEEQIREGCRLICERDGWSAEETAEFTAETLAEFDVLRAMGQT